MTGDSSDRESETHRKERDAARKRVYTVLSDPRCRAVLSVLDRAGPLSLDALATAVRAEERDVAADAVSDADAELHELYHVSVPRLEAAGLVSREDGAVRARLDGPEAVPDVRAFLEADRRRVAASLGQLTVPERRAALTALATADEPMGLSTLAAEMRRLDDFDPGDDADDPLSVVLHHRHLPTLDRAGLVRYDPDAKTVELAKPAVTEGVADEAESSPRDRC